MILHDIFDVFSRTDVQCLPKLVTEAVEVDNDKLRLVNSSYHVKTEFNDCFIYLKE